MQPTSTEVQDYTRLGRKGDSLGIMQEIKIYPYYQVVCAQTRIRLREWEL